MSGQVLSWQWFAASVAVPIAIGIGSALATHSLAVRKARLDRRLLDRRKSYDALLPALADVVAYDQRELRLMYSYSENQQAEDRARAADVEWRARHDAAMSIIRGVVARRELAASSNVLEALDSLLTEYSRIEDSLEVEAPSWQDACEMYAVASLAALDSVRKAVAREA